MDRGTADRQHGVLTAPAWSSIGLLLEESARRFPDRVALICGERRSTYRDLDWTSSGFAAALRQFGLAEQAAIAILARNSDYYAEILFGVAKAGAMLVTLNWRLALPELAAIISDSDIRMLVVEREFMAVAVSLRSLLPESAIFLVIDGEATGTDDYQTFAAAGEDAPAGDVPPEANAILMYTSGTTGVAKGVPATHFALLWGVTAALGIGDDAGNADDVNLLTTPLFHLAGIGWTLASIASGATLVILRTVEPTSMFAAIERHRVTRTVVLPALMPMFLERAEAGADLSCIRLICYGASPIPEPLLVRMLRRFECGFLQNYGMTEVSSSVTFLAAGEHYAGSPRLLSCGRPYPGAELRIQASDGSLCAVGETGEILIRIPSVMKSYWKQPDATSEVLRDGWYLSGDLGFVDAAGFLYLRDRKRDMIVSGGENIYPAEIESALSLHPSVAAAAVIGVPSPRWGEEVKAVVVLKPEAALSTEDLIAFLRTRIGGYKLPKSVDFVSSLPLTPLGKIAKHVLREPFWAGRERGIN